MPEPRRDFSRPGARPTVRDARTDDRDALQEVFRRSSLANERDRPMLLAHPDALELPSPQDGDRVRVAVVNQLVVGFATTRDLGRSLDLIDLFVDPSWMLRGIGHQLVEDAAAHAVACGDGRLEVTANPHALAFYEREGFVTDRDVDTRFGPGFRMHRASAGPGAGRA
jgi:GNAT superfamily N-acetyltransferase